MKPKVNDDIIDIIEVTRSRIEFCVLGRTPLVCNRMSQKTWQQLVAPSPRKTISERNLTMKHNPLAEYRASPYILSNPQAPTAIALMSTAFKGAMMTAALDLPGAKKAQIGRLCFVEGDMVGIYGVPQIYMAIVRMADINRTPDVRTRAILPKWACKVSVEFTLPMMQPQAVANLMAASGFTAGVGDGRPQKGKMSFGQYDIVNADNPEFLDIINTGGRLAQQAALAAPAAYDDETRELLEWYDQELIIRQKRGTAPKPRVEDEAINDEEVDFSEGGETAAI